MPSLKHFDVAVYFGRFQPFHKGHLSLVEHAATLSNTVVILVGTSKDNSTSEKDPWDFETRKKMIEASCAHLKINLFVKALTDCPNDDSLWAQNAYNIIDEHHPKSVVLVGYHKDQSSYYLDLFQKWTYEEYFDETVVHINATDIRTMMQNNQSWQNFVPHEALPFIASPFG